MTKTKLLIVARQFSYVLFSAVLMFACLPNVASAAPIGARSVAIGSSAADATTSYNFTFTVPSTTHIKSVSFTPCLTANGACGTVAGFDASSSTLTAQPTNLGDAAGWSVDGTATAMRLKDTGNFSAPALLTPTVVKFSGVHNPSATNATFYIRIATFFNADYTGAIDDGNVAISTAGQVNVSLTIDEQLAFILSAAAVTLTTPTITTAGTGSTAMTISTNATSGYTLSYIGDTLKSGADNLTAMSTATTSSPNTKQFGMNLVHNTTPAIGADKTGSGTAAPTTGYNTDGTFKFSTLGDTVASVSAPTNTNTFTASYIANMDGSTSAGVYSTILTYIATANF